MVPIAVHIWDIEGFIQIDSWTRLELKALIKAYGVSKLSKDLKIDRGTIDTIHRKTEGKHSISHTISICNRLKFRLEKLEKAITHFGRSQSNLYKIKFPFVAKPAQYRM
ncbi:MAG: hypothetical protein ACE5FT_06530 [Candidatus Nanoarchaeia archaeon]